MTDNAHPIHFAFGNHTDVGCVRQANEDYLGYFNTSNGHVFVVCDGMGGHSGGATAAQMAVDSIRTFFEHKYYDYPREALRQALLYANGQVFAAAQQDPQLRGMGTTAVLVLFRKGEIWHAHVGDSRIYHLTDGRLDRLTRDHSYVQQLMDQGLLTEDEAENHPRRNELTRALGTSREVVVDVSSQPLLPASGDVLLLCTDGLTGLLSDEAIRLELVGGGSVQRRAIRLVERANEAGGYDNITVQLVQFESQTVEAAAPLVLTPTPSVETSVSVTQPVVVETPEPLYTQEMPKRTTARQGPDIPMIVLGVLAVIVVIMFISGSKYMSDDPVEHSELVSGTLDTTTVVEDEIVEPVTEPAPKTNTTKPASTASPATPAPATTTSSGNSSRGSSTTVISHTVKVGETFSSIARRYNLSREALKNLNPSIKNEGTDLKADVTQLKVRVQTVHTVGPGDILSVVARKYNVSKEAIMTANAKTADRSNRGEQLIIPLSKGQ